VDRLPVFRSPVCSHLRDRVAPPTRPAPLSFPRAWPWPCSLDDTSPGHLALASCNLALASLSFAAIDSDGVEMPAEAPCGVSSASFRAVC
jgi:hypothetical protein